MTYDEFVAAWEARRQTFVAFGGQVDGARVVDVLLAELNALRTTEGDRLLTLHAAARLSGYSTEHLGRLLREGVLPNAGRKGSPRICLRDLPIKPQRTVAKGQDEQYDPRADARFFRTGQR